MARTKSEVLGTVTAPSGKLLLVDMGIAGVVVPRPAADAPAGTARPRGHGECERGVRLPHRRAGRREVRPTLGPVLAPAVRLRHPAPRDRSRAGRVRRVRRRTGVRRDAHEAPGTGHAPAADRGRARNTAGGAGQVFFQGIEGFAFDDVPKDTPMRVVGERMGGRDGAVKNRWRWVDLEVRPGVKAAPTKSGPRRDRPRGPRAADVRGRRCARRVEPQHAHRRQGGRGVLGPRRRDQSHARRRPRASRTNPTGKCTGGKTCRTRRRGGRPNRYSA